MPADSLGSRPPRPRKRRFAAVVLVAAVLVALPTVATLAFIVDNALWPAPLCPGCPSNTPVGSVLSLADGVGRCPGGANSSNVSCAYDFFVTEAPGNLAAAPLTPYDLNFAMIGSSGAILPAPFTITLFDLFGGGCGLAAFNSANNSWGPSVSPGECHDLNWSTAPIHQGDVFALAPVPPGGLPFSQPGNQLVVIGVGAFSGQVTVRID
jgi:hypothetical protein